MLRLLPSISAMLAACTPSSQKAAMPSPSPVSGAPLQSSSTSNPAGHGTVSANSGGRGAIRPDQADSAPTSEPATVIGSTDQGPLADSPAEALGRRILSTAFVRAGSDGHLTVELSDGRVLILRDVVMRPKDYCGVHVAGGSGRARYCGGYAEIAAARPGGAPAPDSPGSAASSAIDPAHGRAQGE